MRFFIVALALMAMFSTASAADCEYIYKPGFWIQEGHNTGPWYSTLDDAKAACDAAGDCTAIATQSNHHNGDYRLVHVNGPTYKAFADWQSYNMVTYEHICKINTHVCTASDPHFINVEETKRSYSSIYQGQQPGDMYATSMIDSNRGWASNSGRAIGEWMQIDLDEPMMIYGIMTQGRRDSTTHYVDEYAIKTSIDGVHFTKYIDERYFPGNDNTPNTKVTNMFANPIIAKHVRILPKHRHMPLHLRAAVWACADYVDCKGVAKGTTNKDVCGACGGDSSTCRPKTYNFYTDLNGIGVTLVKMDMDLDHTDICMDQIKEACQGAGLKTMNYLSNNGNKGMDPDSVNMALPSSMGRGANDDWVHYSLAEAGCSEPDGTRWKCDIWSGRGSGIPASEQGPTYTVANARNNGCNTCGIYGTRFCNWTLQLGGFVKGNGYAVCADEDPTGSKPYKQPPPALPSPPTSGTAGKKIEYVGCYFHPEKGQPGHINMLIDNMTIEQCEANGYEYFGSEYPQVSSVPGQSQCLVLQNGMPSLTKVADADCEVEFDSKNRRLGGGNKVAIYKVVSVGGGGPISANSAPPALPTCPVSLSAPLAEECTCTSTTCALGKFCYEDGCHDAARCTVRSNNQKNIFYGAKVYGSWNQSTKVMSMNFTTPYDVKLNSIVWKGASTQDLKFSQTAYGMWKKNIDNPCQPVYQLDVPQTTFFGAGSKFKITGSQLSTNLRVDASETVTTVKNGETYTYARSIRNTVPVLVNLVTKTTIKVRFRTKSADHGKGPGELEDFVLFIAAEDNFADDKKNVVITMQIHSRACVDHERADLGVRVSSGADNIADGKASEFVWATNTDGTKKQDFIHNLCVEELQWTFFPKKYKENTYEIDLTFVSRGTAEEFTTTAAIDIKQADVLADVGFTSSITPYEDEPCTIQASKFNLGQKFYTKIELTDLIVPTTNITCNTYKIKQTKDGVETVTDMKEEVKYAFMEKRIPGDKHICGAELESHHFHINVDGYDTVLETEIIIDYNQNYRRRKLVRVPLSRDMLYEAGYYEHDEYQVGTQMSEEDLKYQNTKREPDEDDMAVKLFIEPEEKSVAFSVSEETWNSVKTLAMFGIFLGAAGFTFGYVSKKYKGEDYVSLIEMQH